MTTAIIEKHRRALVSVRKALMGAVGKVDSLLIDGAPDESAARAEAAIVEALRLVRDAVLSKELAALGDELRAESEKQKHAVRPYGGRAS